MKNIYIVTVGKYSKKTDEEWKQEFELKKSNIHVGNFIH